MQLNLNALACLPACGCQPLVLCWSLELDMDLNASAWLCSGKLAMITERENTKKFLEGGSAGDSRLVMRTHLECWRGGGLGKTGTRSPSPRTAELINRGDGGWHYGRGFIRRRLSRSTSLQPSCTHRRSGTAGPSHVHRARSTLGRPA